MGWKQVDSKGKAKTAAADGSENDVMKEKSGHNYQVRMQIWEFSVD